MFLIAGLSLWGQDNYVLITSPDKVQDVCGRHGLTQVTPTSSHGVFLVSTSSVDPSISTDTDIQTFEHDRALGVPELSGATVANLTQSSTSILDGLPGRTVVNYFGAQVASNYVTQPATTIIRQHDLQVSSGFTGTGVTVAVIDTGVDTSHPALQSSLASGFNFISNVADPSELVDLTPAMAAALAQSSTSILDGQNLVQMNTSVMAILSQSSTSILDGPPGEFGHGTMTAGLVHLVAPGEKIMSLKAFAGDGSSDLFNIVRAIYYAADNGAHVISMSFEIAQGSPALQNAIQYALSKNVVVVAASGNDGGQILVFPSAYNSV
ncbi:MAG TPA: S8 family serine peptidase, partial [Candidatus Binatia bacterium]|nr:S8 family serine peptidase [Candidatus Binatia bacterium]